MKAWKDDSKYSSEEKGNVIVNLVKNITALNKVMPSSLIAPMLL